MNGWRMLIDWWLDFLKCLKNVAIKWLFPLSEDHILLFYLCSMRPFYADSKFGVELSQGTVIRERIQEQIRKQLLVGFIYDKDDGYYFDDDDDNEEEYSDAD